MLVEIIEKQRSNKKKRISKLKSLSNAIKRLVTRKDIPYLDNCKYTLTNLLFQRNSCQ